MDRRLRVYDGLKRFVHDEELKLNGTWGQPGGYRDVLTSDETSISPG